MGRGKSDKALVSFNAGEWSPLLDARIDLEKASSALRKLENYLIETYGCLRRRPGTQYIATTLFTGTRKSTTWRFQFSTSICYTLEVGHEYIRFYVNGAQVMDGGSPYTISTIFQENDLFELQFQQINDVVYITHDNYPPHKLSRLGATDWTIEEIEWSNAPFRAENLTDTTIAPTAGGDDNEKILMASAGIFAPEHVGSYWRVGHLRPANSVELAIAGNLTSAELGILGDYEIRTYGTWTGTVLIERSLDGGTTWTTVRKFKAKNDRNVDATGTADENGTYRIRIEDYVSDTDGRAVLESADAILYGVLKLTSVESTTQATGQVKIPFYSADPTTIWAEGAWSKVNGHPRALCLHQQRLWFGGTRKDPSTIWGSQTSDYENFLAGTDDDEAPIYTLAGIELNAIQWLVSQGALLVGTSGGEWRLRSSSDQKPLTPTTVDADQQSEWGSEYVQALAVNDAVLFVERKGKILREIGYQLDRDKWVSANMTQLSEHVTQGRIVNIARQKDPISTVWVVCADGTLSAMTYDREQNVIGWHRHPTQGAVESVCTIYGASGQDDEVWFTVRRVVQGEDVRFVERLNPNKWTAKEDCFFVDAGATYSGAPATVISGLDYLEGLDVDVLADGDVVPGLAVTGGQITLDTAASKVHVGLNFVSEFQPFRLESDQTVGVSMGRTRKITSLVIRLIKSLGLEYYDGNEVYELPFRDTGTPFDITTPLFTGDMPIDFGTSFGLDDTISIRQPNPLPSLVLGLVPSYNVTGKGK